MVMLGRTANNLFQYALGRVLAERHGVPLVLDGSWFNAEGWSQVSCLKRLPLKATIQRRPYVFAKSIAKLTKRHFWEFLAVPVLKEPAADHRFQRHFLDAPGDCVLMGYFQTPLYFESMAPALREELRMDHLPWSPATMAMAARLREPSSVAVHLRRGDYVENGEFCGINYYTKSIERMRGKVIAPRFFVFSDDPAWCRENLAASDMEVVSLEESKGDPLHDLFLMSQAANHIIANSSYSWWAAWLAERPGQKVFCPSRWFRCDINAPVSEKLGRGWEIVEEDL